MSVTPTAPSVVRLTVDPQIDFYPSAPVTVASVDRLSDSEILKAQEFIQQATQAHKHQGTPTGGLELIGRQTPRSDSPERETMEEGECCKDCRSCLREVCTLENCCACLSCTCQLICCVVDCVIGAKEVQRGRRENDPVRTFVGLEAMGGNSTAVAISAWDQHK
jgi:hypothetical protein